MGGKEGIYLVVIGMFELDNIVMEYHSERRKPVESVTVHPNKPPTRTAKLK